MNVGLAEIDITPPPGLPLMGNFRDDYAARGVHDPLMAKAVVFADAAGRKAAVLALDVCMLDRGNVALIRRAIGRNGGVPPENVLVHATHTHSGPATMNRFLFGVEFEPHRPAVEAMLAKAASAVAAADAHLAPAGLSIGYAAEDRISFNRRLHRKDGATQMNWEALSAGFDPGEIDGPLGPIDPQVACLVVERGGQPAAAIVNFALHPAILAGDNWLYSADYPGYLAESLGRSLGREDGFLALFLNGCCGDVNHIDYRDPLQGRGFKMAQRVGYMLGAAALEAIRWRTPLPAARLSVSRRTAPLRRTQIPEEERRRCRETLSRLVPGALKGQVDGLPEEHFARLRLEMARRQHQPDEVEVMAIRLGDAAVVGLPGEAFCALGLAIKERSPLRHTLVAGLSNDAIGYLPTRGAFGQGGYETLAGSTFYEPGAAERLVEAAVEAVSQG